MNVIEAIQLRKSIRAYEDRPVEEEKLQAVLEAARLAPSANNSQEWRFVVVRDQPTREKLMVASNHQLFVAEAPVVIVCCAQTDGRVMRCGQLAYPINVAIAIDHMTLVAVELGLGTCWIGSFYEDQVREILGIPEEIPIVELLTLGYPAEPGRSRQRKSLEEIVMYESWRNDKKNSIGRTDRGGQGCS